MLASALSSISAWGQEKKPKEEAKLTIYDDENLQGKNVVIHKNSPDLHEVKFSDKSESIEWQLPAGKAFVVFDDKNFKLPLLVLVGKGQVKDLGKEQRNALHSITSVALVPCPKDKYPQGVPKDVPKLGGDQ